MSLYVIDDHPMVRQMIGMLLRRLRPASKVVELEKYSELQAALIKNGEPELFVLDLLLPGVKGATAISDVKKMYPEIPLVVLSAMPSGEARDACLEAGADLYIEKSTDTAEISAAIQDILKSDDDEVDADTVVLGDIKLSKRQKQLILILHVPTKILPSWIPISSNYLHQNQGLVHNTHFLQILSYMYLPLKSL